MPIVAITNAGEHGIVTELAPHELPLNAWSAGKNVHFVDGFAEKIGGHQSVFGTPTVAPYFAMSVKQPSGLQHWVYAGAGKVYTYDGSAHTDLTRAAGGDYTATLDKLWNGGILNGVPILNNGVDVPQMWTPLSSAQRLQALTAWPATATAAVMRSYKNYLVALDITKSGTRDPRLVKWSHPAAAGAVPSSWDETDPTKDAGEYSLAETDGFVLDCATLRDVNVIYKDDSVWGMQWVGGLDIFRFFNLFKGIGALSKNCAVEYQTGRHAVFAQDDLFSHDGQVPTPILRKRMRKWLFNNISAEYAKRSFVVHRPQDAEVWFCFPETGQTLPNLALVWNWVTGACGVREIPNTPWIAGGVVQPTTNDIGDAWNADSSTWGADSASWGSTPFNPSVLSAIIVDVNGTKLHALLDGLTNFDGTSFEAQLQRTHFGIPFKTNIPPDISGMKFVSEIWPKITGTAGGVVQVRFGSHMDVNTAATWGAWQDYTIGTTQKLDVTTSGRLFAIEFRSTTDIAWNLQGYDLNARLVGNF